MGNHQCSEGKEHILTAESHRAMMTWAQALQTKRDAWDKMMTLGANRDEVRLTYTEAQQKALRSTDKAATQGRKQSLQLNGSAQEALKKMVQVSWEKGGTRLWQILICNGYEIIIIIFFFASFVISALTGLLRHSETPKHETEANPSSEIPSREPSPRQCDPIREEDAKESSPETESASESDRLAAQEDDEDDLEASPLLRLSEVHMKISSSSDSDVGESRLSVLQNELISVKCELAKCLNREKSCKMALEVKEAELKKLKLERDFEKKQREMQELRSKLEMLQNRNRFLNDEIQKLSRMLQQEQFRNHSKQLNLQDMSAEVDQLKRDYVFLLQSCIRITCTDGPEMMELYMYGEKRHKQRVFALLEEARKVDSSLPNLEGMTTSLCHVDSIIKQLGRTRHVAAWKRYLKKHPNNVLRPSTELKTLVRGGVPEQLRGRVWSALYRIKVQDLRETKGPKYFENLCSRSAEAEIQENHKRQISLDLLRTMPNNIHFCDRNAEGIQKLQSVLHAFCLHNPKLGYCQGMNFLVGMMLLFVDAEDAFWCLVAIVERYFPSSYFDQNLIGAQADQELLKELLRNKLPKISAHLAALDIELSTVTLNWFLSLFIDSVPIE
ncbi:TBC1 domain family member 2B like protein [Argiope bruennichi]|uniref:TBC1 domain family member 2B like protein n=1 Tax=Argiope bruennichi TaxID=94029 RepID=A0A8T0EV88_ARGBR|nr:TBC1 domain family member 2B like protein [Argiope bruennichi]